jgi:hypothetical protein
MVAVSWFSVISVILGTACKTGNLIKIILLD